MNQQDANKHEPGCDGTVAADGRPCDCIHDATCSCSWCRQRRIANAPPNPRNISDTCPACGELAPHLDPIECKEERSTTMNHDEHPDCICNDGRAHERDVSEYCVVDNARTDPYEWNPFDEAWQAKKEQDDD